MSHRENTSMTPSPIKVKSLPNTRTRGSRGVESGLVEMPRERAGLRSSKKRSIEELIGPSVQRAYKTKISLILNYEDAFSDDDLEQLDLAIVDGIIKDSRAEGHGTKEVEEVVPEQEPQEVSDNEFQPSDGSNEADLGGSDSEVEVIDLSDEEFMAKKKKGSGSSKRKARREDDNKTSSEEIVSIFKNGIEQEGPTEGFLEGPEGPESSLEGPENNTKNRFSDNVDSLGIPIVSGIQINVPQIASTKFLPLPVPKIIDGKIPNEYIKEHLPDIEWDTLPNNEAADDRVYFVDGTAGFFEQTSNRDRHSVMLLSSLGIELSRQEFLSNIEFLQQFKQNEKRQLRQLYATLHQQWSFELSQGFNLCFYGLGSKTEILNDYVRCYLANWIQGIYQTDYPKLVVINGYNPAFKVKDIFNIIVQTLLPGEAVFSKNIADAIPYVIKQVDKTATTSVPKLVLVVHGIDAEPMRDERVQTQLSQLASIPQIMFLCSVENVNYPLLWDLYKVENLNLIFHDLTTYEPYYVETQYKDPINLGKTKRTQSSRGAKFVLSALTANSKKMYKILLELQLQRIHDTNPRTNHEMSRGSLRTSVSFKAYHQECVQQFITANDISFRTMLNEFVEHNMCNLTKDDAGLERVYVGYTVEEMKRLIARI